MPGGSRYQPLQVLGVNVVVDDAIGTILGLRDADPNTHDLVQTRNRATWVHHRGASLGLDTVKRLGRDGHYRGEMKRALRALMTEAEQVATDARYDAARRRGASTLKARRYRAAVRQKRRRAGGQH